MTDLSAMNHSWLQTGYNKMIYDDISKKVFQSAKDLMNKGGSIINVSSVNGLRGKGGSDIYDMTKAAVNNFTLNLARQLAPKKITVNAVCPSSTITPMRDDAMQRYLVSGTREEFDAHEAGTIPLGRLCDPEEIAEMIAFLASEKARYITGQIISVDGGFSVMPRYFGSDES